jgi:RNA polymerase-interacting CarD/CdnL/TRCF family regulator
MFKIGDKVIHKKYGEGTVIKDINEDCKKDEVMIKFIEHIGIPKVNMNSTYSGFQG